MALRLQNRFQVLTSIEEQGECLTLNNQNPILQSKIYFKLIQATHHIEILENAISTNTPPPGMKKQVHKLTDFIKPACPNNDTYDRIKTNTDVWMKKTLNILSEHYDEVIMEQLRVMDRFDGDLFEKAVGWAKARYKRKLTQTSINRVRTLIRDGTQSESSSSGGAVNNGSPIMGQTVHHSTTTANVTDEVEGDVLISNSLPEKTFEATKLHPPLTNSGTGQEDGSMDELSSQSSTLNSFGTDVDEEEEDDYLDFDLLEPTIHKASNRKILEWNIIVNKTVLFIGDTNLSRIPYFTEPGIQIDSFPDATLYHLSGILQKLQPNRDVQKVILSVGLNNCLQGNETSTTKKQIQQLHKHCHMAFPSATIFFPLINCSEKLKPHTKRLVEDFNTVLRGKYNFLPKLQDARFKVSPTDNVHWLSDTAGAILDLWLKELKLT